MPVSTKTSTMTRGLLGEARSNAGSLSSTPGPWHPFHGTLSASACSNALVVAPSGDCTTGSIFSERRSGLGTPFTSDGRAQKRSRRHYGDRHAVARTEPVTRGTGNVFGDLGFPHAAERQARLRLAHCPESGTRSAQALAGRGCRGAWRHAVKPLCASPVQAGRLLSRTANEPVDGRRFRRRHRDSNEAPLAERSPDQGPPISTSTSIARHAA